MKQDSPAAQTAQAFDILTTYVGLEQGSGAVALPVTPAFWESMGEGGLPGAMEGRLVSGYSFDADWPTWEMHPAGEELVLLLSGAAELLLRGEDGVTSVLLEQAGSFVLVPRGVWHTAKMRSAGPVSMLFVTPGAGTRHEAI